MCYQQVFAPLLVGGYYTCSWAPTDEHGDLLVIQGLNGGSSKASAWCRFDSAKCGFDQRVEAAEAHATESNEGFSQTRSLWCECVAVLRWIRMGNTLEIRSFRYFFAPPGCREFYSCLLRQLWPESSTLHWIPWLDILENWRCWDQKACEREATCEVCQLRTSRGRRFGAEKQSILFSLLGFWLGSEGLHLIG